MTLAELKQGETAKVIFIGGGRNAQQQLRELGLYPGDSLRVVRRAQFGGPLLIEFRGMQVAVGRRIAEDVVVE